MRRQHRLALSWIVTCAVAYVAIVSCGGKALAPQLQSESHFLRYCSEACSDGLSCIDGFCTQGCVIGEADACSERAADAECTNLSGEPGAVAVCDVACDDSVDCSALGESHACYDGYCRAPEIPASAASAGSALYPYVQPLDFPLGRDHLACGIPEGLFDEEGRMRCTLIRAEQPEPGMGQPDCNAPGRAPVSPELAAAVRSYMAGDSCEDAQGDCLDWPLCEFLQIPAGSESGCQNSTGPAADISPSGFCGLDPFSEVDGGIAVDSPLGPVVEEECGLGARAVRLTGDHTVVDSAITEIWMACEVEP